MHDRVHACLDGELAPNALSFLEQRELASVAAAINQVIEHLDSGPAPDLSAAVMSNLPSPRRERLRFEWCCGIKNIVIQIRSFRPSGLALRPVAALAAAVIALFALRGLPGPLASTSDANVDSHAAPAIHVRFDLVVPGASQVALAGDFSGWQPEHEMREITPGAWSVVVPLQAGVYDYVFVVDGTRQVTDPRAVQVADSFGGANNRLFLLPPTSST